MYYKLDQALHEKCVRCRCEAWEPRDNHILNSPSEHRCLWPFIHVVHNERVFNLCYSLTQQFRIIRRYAHWSCKTFYDFINDGSVEYINPLPSHLRIVILSIPPYIYPINGCFSQQVRYFFWGFPDNRYLVHKFHVPIYRTSHSCPRLHCL